MSKSTRIVELVHMLSGRRSRTVAEIADKLEVSERTAFRYIADLEQQRIPVYKDDHGYRLLDSATLKPLNLTAEEHALLKVALNNPALRGSSALKQRLTALELKLDAATELIEESPRALQLASINRSGPRAQDVLEPLRDEISKRHVVEIKYDSLTGGKHTWRHVDPWQVFERNEAWYLVGRCHIHDAPRMFRLDRISGTRGTDQTFEMPSDFSLDDFLDRTWKVFTGDGHYQVHLRFDKSLAPLILNAQTPPRREGHQAQGRLGGLQGGALEPRGDRPMGRGVWGEVSGGGAGGVGFGRVSVGQRGVGMGGPTSNRAAEYRPCVFSARERQTGHSTFGTKEQEVIDSGYSNSLYRASIRIQRSQA